MSMAKKTYKSGSKTTGSAKVMARDASTGQFLVGRAAFKKISAVEGIKLSKGLARDLARTDSMSPVIRRDTLSSKYGKKK